MICLFCVIIVPFVSRLFPSDLCKIRKFGSFVRFDYTIVDFKNKKFERGDISFLFDGDVPVEESAVFMDNKKMVYQRVKYQVAKLGFTGQYLICAPNSLTEFVIRLET